LLSGGVGALLGTAVGIGAGSWFEGQVKVPSLESIDPRIAQANQVLAELEDARAQCVFNGEASPIKTPVPTVRPASGE
jgi:hypothetical protein